MLFLGNRANLQWVLTYGVSFSAPLLNHTANLIGDPEETNDVETTKRENALLGKP